MSYQGTLDVHRSRPVHVLFFVCAALAILGSLLAAPDDFPWRWLHYLTKPTATLLLLVVVLRTISENTQRLCLGRCYRSRLRGGRRCLSYAAG